VRANARDPSRATHLSKSMRFFRALRFWSGQCRECGTGSPVAEMANMLSTTTPPPQRYASMRGTRGRRCGNDGTLGRSKRDPQAFYDKGYLNCRFAWDYARTPISAGSGFHGPCLTCSMTLRLLQKGNISIEGRTYFSSLAGHLLSGSVTISRLSALRTR